MPENIVLTEATYYILLSLYDPQHGYGIMQEVERLSKGRVRLATGTLYGALNSMVEKGWIIQLPVEDGSRKKNYQITSSGLKILKDEIERLRELVVNGDEIMNLLVATLLMYGVGRLQGKIEYLNKERKFRE